MHTGIPCVQNKKLLVQKASVNERLNKPSVSTYASALKQQPNRFTSTNARSEGNHEISDEDISITDLERTSNHPLTETGSTTREQSSTTTTTMEIDRIQSRLLVVQISRRLQSLRMLWQIWGLWLLPPSVHRSSCLIPPTNDDNVLGNKHKRDDGNNTDDSTTSSTGKKERKQNKKHHKH